jgi:4'-phosphopantetheinyl transferase
MSNDTQRTVLRPVCPSADAAVAPHVRPHVDVWCLPLVVSPTEAAELARLLSAGENACLDRIASHARRQRACIAWASRRSILARYLGCDPHDVGIVRHGRGAPIVDAPGRPLHVSLSHTGDWMLLAVSRTHRVGVDIERIDPAVDVVRLARRFFPTDEADELASLPSTERHEAFFRAWTSKEAILKGVGGGVPSRLRSVPSGIARPREAVPMAGTVWTLYELAAPRLYAATLAANGQVAVVLHDAASS